MVETTPARDTRSDRTRRLAITVGAVLLAFLVGFGWQWVEARGYRGERDEAVRELELQRLATTLASAIIQADRGSYESARELASRFFTGLQATVDRVEQPQATAELGDILGRRDAVITALSRSDPSSEDELTRMFVRYQVATGGDDIGLAVPAIEMDGAPAPMGDTSRGAASGGG